MTVQRMTNCSRRGYLGAPNILSINAITRNLLAIGLVLITVIFQGTVSMPSRLTIRSAKEDDGFVFPRAEEWWNAKGQEKTIKRETSRQGNDVDSTGDIVFPTEESDNEQKLNVFTPGPAPECRMRTYCENTDSYPAQYVDNALQQNNDLKFLAGIDEVSQITQRIGDDTTSLCQSEEKLVFPTSAQNREDEWSFVVNQDNFRQGVRIETCLSSDSECSVIGGSIQGYKTTCKQKYILRQMASITTNGTVVRDLFKMPSSCCCHIKFDGTFSRIGMNSKFQPSNQTPVPKTRRRRKTSINY